MAFSIKEQFIETVSTQEPKQSKISIYEVIRIKNRKPLFINEHLTRLQNSATLVGMSIWISLSEIKRKVALLLKKNDLPEGNIKIIMSTQTGSGKRIKTFSTGFIAHYYPTKEQYKTGVTTAILKAERPTPNAKTINTSVRNLANKAIKELNVYEVLLVNNEDFVTEGSRSNLFFIDGKKIFTPPLTEVLPGITRQKVLEICQHYNIELQEQEIGIEDLPNFNAAFLSGTSPKILPIARIEHHVFDVNNSILRQIMKLYDELI